MKKRIDKIVKYVFSTNRKKVVAIFVAIILVVLAVYTFGWVKNNKKFLGLGSLSMLNKVSQFLPISKSWTR